MPKAKGWWRNTFETKVDITPRGEESRHIAEASCECRPRLSADDAGRLMIIHNSYDGQEGIDCVDFKPRDFEYTGRRAA